jgi:hypothetical protein
MAAQNLSLDLAKLLHGPSTSPDPKHEPTCEGVCCGVTRSLDTGEFYFECTAQAALKRKEDQDDAKQTPYTVINWKTLEQDAKASLDAIPVSDVDTALLTAFRWIQRSMDAKHLKETDVHNGHTTFIASLYVHGARRFGVDRFVLCRRKWMDPTTGALEWMDNPVDFGDIPFSASDIMTELLRKIISHE